MSNPASHPWWTDAVRRRVGLISRGEATKRGVPHLTRPKYAAELDELDRFWTWLEWFETPLGTRGPRPKGIWRSVPAWAWKVQGEYETKHPRPKPPPSSPPPKPKPQPETEGAHPDRWVGLGFVATAANASPTLYATGPIRIVCPQIAFGLNHPDTDPDLESTRRLISGCRAVGLEVAGWAWCADASQADAEGRYHAKVALGLGLLRLVANMEEPYDAHGASGDPRYLAPDVYAQAFRAVTSQVELGLTTTPRWGSSGNGFRAAGATIMPQAFTGEVPSATIPACVEHAEAWGWPRSRIRPLVQCYETNGVRPDAVTYNADAARYGVGVVPYTLEQTHDGEGQEMLRTLAPSITRVPM